MIELCPEAGLPESQFEQRSGFFVITLWRDWLTDKIIAELNLSDRQKLAISYIKTRGRISNTEYQHVAHTIKKTATRDLNDLKDKGLIAKMGSRGAGVHYILAKKGTKWGHWGHEDI